MVYVCVCVQAGKRKKKTTRRASQAEFIGFMCVCLYLRGKRLDGSAEQVLCILFMCGSTCARQHFSVSRPPINLKHVHLRTFSNLQPPPNLAAAFLPSFGLLPCVHLLQHTECSAGVSADTHTHTRIQLNNTFLSASNRSQLSGRTLSG